MSGEGPTCGPSVHSLQVYISLIAAPRPYPFERIASGNLLLRVQRRLRQTNPQVGLVSIFTGFETRPFSGRPRNQLR
jgi:hypothetical protein